MAHPSTGRHDQMSNLVNDSRIEASWDPDSHQTTHTRKAIGPLSRQRRLKPEEIWQRKCRLGAGASGVVWLEECIACSKLHGNNSAQTGQLRAVKEIHRRPNVSAKESHRELEAIAKFSQQKFIHYFVTSFGWFETEASLFIVMEYFKHGDLQRYLNKPFPEVEARQVVLQIVTALEFMHDSGFAHRDLKPSNVLVLQRGPSWWVKLGDFGISKRVGESVGLTTLEIGTRGFMAPEVIGICSPDDLDDDNEHTERAQEYSFTVDMWAVGEITHRMLTNKPSFETPRQLARYVTLSSPFPTGELKNVNASADCALFIQNTMAASSKARLTAAQAIEHSWMIDHEFIDDTDHSRSSIESTIQESTTGLRALDTEASAQWSTEGQRTVDLEADVNQIPSDPVTETELSSQERLPERNSQYRVPYNTAPTETEASITLRRLYESHQQIQPQPLGTSTPPTSLNIPIHTGPSTSQETSQSSIVTSDHIIEGQDAPPHSPTSPNESQPSPTKFEPPLYLKCGPLLRYCGIRKGNREANSSHIQEGIAIPEREIWRGTVMIVTKDSESSYEIIPNLRFFIQDITLQTSPPPRDGPFRFSPLSFDPITGHSKIGCRGETLYLRPRTHIQGTRNSSQMETEEDLFTKSPIFTAQHSVTRDQSNHPANRLRQNVVYGIKYKDYEEVKGFLLHSERGHTFWRFDIEVELEEKQQRVAYQINGGPTIGFWVPARNQTMRMMFYSGNGCSYYVDLDNSGGINRMWQDVLNKHQTSPFHLMIGGGGQIYNSPVMREAKLFHEWLDIRNPLQKREAPFNREMEVELETFYLEHYCTWFSQGLFSIANSQIPMVNMYNDEDIIDGYGTYPHFFMNAPVMSGLGNVAFKYYMLFQHQSAIDKTNTESSWILGSEPGPYIRQISRSISVPIGTKAVLVAVDTFTERTEKEIVSEKTWQKIMDRLYAESYNGQIEHILLLLGDPISYPRVNSRGNSFTSRLRDSATFLPIFGKTAPERGFLDRADAYWSSEDHAAERKRVIEDLQDLAMDRKLRVTILSGNPHSAGVGQLYSNHALPSRRDPRFMRNIITSSIVEKSHTGGLVDRLYKRHKVSHVDAHTDEDMMPLGRAGPDGNSKKAKYLIAQRSWCSIGEWENSGHRDINREGQLSICFNIESNPKDPSSIVVPHQISIPRLARDFVDSEPGPQETR